MPDDEVAVAMAGLAALGVTCLLAGQAVHELREMNRHLKAIRGHSAAAREESMVNLEQEVDGE
jgi:hypothetical protein